MRNSRSCRAGTGPRFTVLMGAAAALLAVAGCSRNQDSGTDAAAVRERSEIAYTARLVPLNTTVTGSQAAGEVTFSITGDRLTIGTDARGLPKAMTHWQHFHGFEDGRDAACPTNAADANGDGLVDLIETEPVSGTTMVPFNDDPVAMDIPNGTYPDASSTGTMEYEKTISLSALEEAFGTAFGGQGLDLDKRVVFVHGVPPEARLPASVASLGPIPAHVTIPIACGEIRRAKT